MQDKCFVDEDDEDGVIKEKQETNIVDLYKKSICPECGSKLQQEGGCNICKNCGWTKCD